MIEYIRFFFYVIFVVFNMITYFMVKEVEDNKKCECRNNKKITKAYYFLNTIEYIKTFSWLASVIGSVNLLIPINKGLSNIIIIGSMISIALFILLIGQMFSLNRFLTVIKSDECVKTCKMSSFYNKFSDYIMAGTFITYVIIIILVLMGLKQ